MMGFGMVWVCSCILNVGAEVCVCGVCLWFAGLWAWHLIVVIV